MKALSIAASCLLVFGMIGAASAGTMEIKHASNTGVPLAGETRALADGSNYMVIGNKWVVSTEVADYPLNDSSMDCTGSCKASEDLSAGDCFGYCGGVDADGDLFSFTWDGYVGGNWSTGAGSGKFEGWSGTGTWESVPLSDPAVAKVNWQGSITMK
jgi:hypothetical protein